MMVTCHSNTLASSTKPALNPSMGFRASSARRTAASAAASGRGSPGEARRTRRRHPPWRGAATEAQRSHARAFQLLAKKQDCLLAHLTGGGTARTPRAATAAWRCASRHAEVSSAELAAQRRALRCAGVRGAGAACSGAQPGGGRAAARRGLEACRPVPRAAAQRRVRDHRWALHSASASASASVTAWAGPPAKQSCTSGTARRQPPRSQPACVGRAATSRLAAFHLGLERTRGAWAPCRSFRPPSRSMCSLWRYGAAPTQRATALQGAPDRPAPDALSERR